jgi:uncharacterized RDD family membrane protein YckC
MFTSSLVLLSLLSAVTLAVAYQPMLEKLSWPVISPYPKADLLRRGLAAAVDVSVVAMLLAVYRVSGHTRYFVFAIAYALLRDTIMGRSLGKFLFGLTTIDIQTGLPGGFRQSFSRNVLLVLPGANVVAVFKEVRTLLNDPQGQRLGDRFAWTQVVHGFGVKDLLQHLIQFLQGIHIQHIDSDEPGRVPVR